MGFPVGSCVGRKVGVLVGDVEGGAVGIMVGPIVGLDDGKILGSMVGHMVGADEGGAQNNISTQEELQKHEFYFLQSNIVQKRISIF